MKNVVYEEWVATGTLVKALVGFFSLLIMCILWITIAVGFAIQHPFLIVVLASPLAFVLLVFARALPKELEPINVGDVLEARFNQLASIP